MGDDSNIWRDRLRQALLDELTSQERRAGNQEKVARIIAERRLAVAAYKAHSHKPPELHELPEEVQRLLGVSRRQRRRSQVNTEEAAT
jgi:hypothetical protein